MPNPMLLTPAEIEALRALMRDADRSYADTEAEDGREAAGYAADRYFDALERAAPALLLAAEMLPEMVAAAEEVTESCGEHGVLDLRAMVARYRAALPQATCDAH